LPARGARAALALAAGLLALALPTPSGVSPACPRPAERSDATGRAVVCGGAGAALSGPALRVLGLPVDPNRADTLTLETLPGVGPARAAAIVAAREARPFAASADLGRVPGIGPKTLARLAGLVRVEAR
jgi:competence protein ComEA